MSDHWLLANGSAYFKNWAFYFTYCFPATNVWVHELGCINFLGCFYFATHNSKCRYIIGSADIFIRKYSFIISAGDNELSILTLFLFKSSTMRSPTWKIIKLSDHNFAYGPATLPSLGPDLIIRIMIWTNFPGQCNMHSGTFKDSVSIFL